MPARFLRVQVQKEWTDAMVTLRATLAALPPVLARTAYLLRLHLQFTNLLRLVHSAPALTALGMVAPDRDPGVAAAITCACYCVADDLAGLLRLDPVATAAVLGVPAGSLLSPRPPTTAGAATTASPAAPSPAMPRNKAVYGGRAQGSQEVMQAATAAGWVCGEAMEPVLACPGPLVDQAQLVTDLRRLPGIAECLGESAFGDRLLLKVGCGVCCGVFSEARKLLDLFGLPIQNTDRMLCCM
jgi:hypothetical protein